MKEFDFFGTTLESTPRKIVVHVVMREIRHWAQIATLFRLHGLSDRFHDFLFSPVLGGELRTRQGIRLSEEGPTLSPSAMVEAG